MFRFGWVTGDGATPMLADVAMDTGETKHVSEKKKSQKCFEVHKHVHVY
jgi:hypothetical protein